VISKFKSNGPKFNESPPTDIKVNDIRNIAELYALVKEGYGSALANEIKMWVQWVKDINKHIEPTEKISDLTSEILSLVGEVQSAGFPDKGISRELKELIATIDLQATDNAINLIRKIEELSMLEAINAMAICSKYRLQIDSLLEMTDKLLVSISGIVDVKNSAIQLNLGKGMKENIAAINNSLDQSIMSLSNLSK
jgi:hypothetical protein